MTVDAPARQRATTSASRRRQRAAELVLAGYDTAAIAAELGCSLRSAQRYVAEAEPLVAELRQQRLVAVADRLRQEAEAAVAVLAAIATDHAQPAAARVSAAARLLAELRGYSELTDVLRRIEALEQALESQPREEQL